MALSPAVEKFVLHWGEMGTKWGVNRTMAQIHALLYTSPKPLHAEEISEVLRIARSNASTSLKDLQGWGIIKVTHVLGDRRDHFESMKDPWELFQIIMDERKKREIDPTLTILRECIAETSKTEKSNSGDAYAKQKLVELQDFVETMANWYVSLRKMPTQAVVKFIKTGDKFRKFLGIGT
jgi:DNA-binding transcriptional regulator GbsR (MarR family)